MAGIVRALRFDGVDVIGVAVVQKIFKGVYPVDFWENLLGVSEGEPNTVDQAKPRMDVKGHDQGRREGAVFLRG